MTHPDLPSPRRSEPPRVELGLMSHYHRLIEHKSIERESRFEDMQVIGRGGQGIVFRCERSGADGFRSPVALKIFSPAVYSSSSDYEMDMERMASVAMKASPLQNHQLLHVHNIIHKARIRIMVMEWVNGYDLHHLLSPATLDLLRSRVSPAQWANLNDVVITEGSQQSRLKPGIAIRILRECLTGLAALHKVGVAHGDIKPSNVMVKLTGNVKLVDFGSAVDLHAFSSRIACTPAYAAPEILDGSMNSPQSDLASLGYVLVEILSGCILFLQKDSLEILNKKKLSLPDRLKEILPPDVVRNRDLMDLCHALVNPNPDSRMTSAEEANIVWAANLHRQLVKTDLDSEYENDLRIWMESLPPKPPIDSAPPTADPAPRLSDGTAAGGATTELSESPIPS